ncbi:peroxide stress protein YaaA [Saprospiraceae bacterium]|jgi:cytoplasmic iron level regulating protein YaaA (DUF328/UPF0246 family)|nr:peroxide stress protein YaaA [Bacteroidota bacterium]MDB4728481.1 peroxide stress protein YaaA [Saprospiraceae bacterium]MDF1866495.1 peroxide stress protein YaaA [Saprospiraceae bacterium]
MIILISPAKTLNFDPTDLKMHTTPRMLADSEKLVKVMKKKSAKKIKELMSVSDNIAELNVERYQNYHTPFTLENAKQSILAFKGDVYTGLQAENFSEKEMAFAQKHLRILSGLYGLLKPLDLMQPYRLEMGTRLKNGRKKNLYEFWDKKITNLINEDLAELGSNIILNLASKEYFHSVKPDLLDGELYSANFKENRNGVYKVISFTAKKARGAMSRQIIQNNITDIEELKGLEVEGYVYNEEMSSEYDLMFTMG